jgi:hypothetical protein
MHESAYGTELKSQHVRDLVAIRGKADVTQTSAGRLMLTHNGLC